jgi:hypothetical protein
VSSAIAHHLQLRVEAALRGEGVAGSDVRPTRSLGELALIATVAAMGYGAIMGSYAAVYGGPMKQMLFGAIKAPMLLMVTALLTLPSFIVINTLLGLRRDLGQVLHAMASAQAVVAIILLSCAPLTLVWYASVHDYDQAILFNGFVFAIASFGAQKPLRKRYAPLIARNRTHATLLKVWLVVYAFVGIQMGWVLRPFIGKPDAPAEFFRADKWDNAYVIVVRLIWRAIH